MSLDPNDWRVIGQMVQSMVSAMFVEYQEGLAARLGVAGQGYDPVEGTAGKVFGHTVSFFDEDDGQTIVRPSIPIATTQPGDLYGPTGNERVVMVRTQGGGYVTLFHHGADDSPQTPAGERHILHKTKATQGLLDANGQPIAAQWDGGVRLLNDGPTEGDGKGTTEVGHQGALTRSQAVGPTGAFKIETDATSEKAHTVSTPGDGTKPGLKSKWDDIANAITHVASASAEQQLYSIVDGAGNAISHVVGVGGQVGIGDLASNMAFADNAAVNISHLTSYDGNLQTAKLNDYIAYSNLLHSAGTITTPQLVTILAALVEGWTHNTEIPTCSQFVLVRS